MRSKTTNIKLEAITIKANYDVTMPKKLAQTIDLYEIIKKCHSEIMNIFAEKVRQELISRGVTVEHQSIDFS